MKVLFISARFPYPPLRGDQVRAYHQLRLLGSKHQITLFSLTDIPVSAEARQTIESFCERVVTFPLRKPRMVISLLSKIFSTYPLQTAIYQIPDLQKAIRHVLETQGYDLVHIQLARMAPYVENEVSVPRVIDLIDALSLNMERRYYHDRGPLKWMAFLEWKRMQQYERIICQKFDHVTVVSPVDAQTIGSYPNLTININGVDLSRLLFSNGEREPYTIIFSGNMGYFPNVNAVLWFSQQVLPHIKAAIPQVKFYIVGARPAQEIQQLAKHNANIVVTGFVDDLSVFLQRAGVAVAPMNAGSGQQFKVIEAMACGTPVVTTSKVLNSIEAVDGEHLLVADNADIFARQVIKLLQDSNLAGTLALNARRLVEEKYAWERSVENLEEIYYSIFKR